jgi:hypothetical protein
MAAREYSIPIIALTSLTAVPFLQIATPATTSVEIYEIVLGQETSETNQQEAISLARRSTASTLPTAQTGIAIAENDPATLLASSTTTNAQGIASVTGTLTSTPLRWTFNTLGGLTYAFQLPFVIKPSGFATLQFITAPAANTWTGFVLYRELS